MTYFRTKFHIPRSSGSLFIEIKQRQKDKVHPIKGHEDPEGAQNITVLFLYSRH